MIRHYCDRCKSEYSNKEDNLWKIQLPLTHINYGANEFKVYDLCINCINFIKHSIESMPRTTVG